MNEFTLHLYNLYLQETGDKVVAALLTLATHQTPAAPTTADRPMSVPEVARFLRVTTNKVLRWIHCGELPATNVATLSTGRGRYRVSHAGLAAFQQHRASLTTQSVAPRRTARRSIRPFPKTRHPTT